MYFDNIIYINLSRRPDRNKNVIDQLQKFGLQDNSQRIEAVDGRNLNLNSLPIGTITPQGINEATNPLLNKRYTSLTNGAIGCAMSHKKAFEKIVEKNKPSLILEDDITLCPDFVKKISGYEHNFPNDADIIFLGYHPSRKSKLKMVNGVVGVPEAIFGLFGYIVTPKGAQRLLDMFPITKQIDSEMSSHFKSWNVYAVSPDKKIIISDLSQESDTFGTDIQNVPRVSSVNNKKELLLTGLLVVVVFFIITNVI